MNLASSVLNYPGAFTGNFKRGTALRHTHSWYHQTVFEFDRKMSGLFSINWTNDLNFFFILSLLLKIAVMLSDFRFYDSFPV